MNSENESSLNKDKQCKEKWSSERKHKCAVCQKSFSRRGHLDTHLLSHSGEKPHECPTCQKGFAHKGALNEHLSIHSGDKPHECPICFQQFRLKSNFRKHMLMHSRKKQHTPELVQQIQQSSLLIETSTLGGRVLKVVSKFNTSKEYEIKPSASAKRCFDQIAKSEIDAVLEPSKSSFCFEVPIIKQEFKTEEDWETPSSSYQTLNVKQEPTENADHACLNLCDDKFIKEETELPSTI